MRLSKSSALFILVLTAGVCLACMNDYGQFEFEASPESTENPAGSAFPIGSPDGSASPSATSLSLLGLPPSFQDGGVAAPAPASDPAPF